MRETAKPKHHEIFGRFACWEGYVEPGFSVNFLGVKTRSIFFSQLQDEGGKFVSTCLPKINEEYFEWIDLLEAVTGTRGQFTMIELGAGFGRWLVNAATALRFLGNSSYRLIGVEAEPTHFQWMKVHLEDNAINLRQCQLLEVAIADRDGSVWFQVGRPREWYGQTISHTVPKWPQRLRQLLTGSGSQLKKVNALSLNSLLNPLEEVDLIDLDVQGSEFEVLGPAREQLDQKVRRVHVGTHSTEAEGQLRKLFQAFEWRCLNDYSLNTEAITPWGIIRFQDGVQTWVNPNLR